MEDVKSEKIEYLFLDIEWNQAPGTSDLDGREAIQIGVVAADAQIQKVKAFSKAIRLSDPKLFNKKTEILSHTPLANIMQGNEEKAVLEKFAQSFPQYCHLIVWSRDTYELFLRDMRKYGITIKRHRVVVLQDVLGVIAGSGNDQIGFENALICSGIEYVPNYLHYAKHGADIFKVAGGGQNYVHGGSSLQEMLIPVIELTTNTRAVAYDYVDVILTSVNRKVTNLITYFDFIQTEKVTDTMKARSLVAYFTTEDGEKISFDVPIVANSREDAPEKRTFHEKFTLKSREYKYGDKYYLVLADANNEKNILQQYEFMIDIAFVDDFGF